MPEDTKRHTKITVDIEQGPAAGSSTKFVPIRIDQATTVHVPVTPVDYKLYDTIFRDKRHEDRLRVLRQVAKAAYLLGVRHQLEKK